MKISDFFYNEFDLIAKDEIPAEWWLERFRNWRIEELKNTDWTQLPDAPVSAEIWAEYRQTLRDLPSKNNFHNVELPEKPFN